MAGRGGWLGHLPRPLRQGLGALPQARGNLEQHMGVRAGRKCRLILKVSRLCQIDIIFYGQRQPTLI